MKNRKNVLAIVLCFAFFTVWSQDTINNLSSATNIVDATKLRNSKTIVKDENSFKVAKNAIYLELFGSALFLYNISYDRVLFSKGIQKVSVALGFQVEDRFDIGAQNSLNPQINYILGKNSALELGVGCNWNLEKERLRACIFRVGYRYQKKNRPFIKVAFTPTLTQKSSFVFGAGWKLIPFGGIAIGHSF